MRVSPLPAALERIASEIGRELQASIDALAEDWYQRMLAIAELAYFADPRFRPMALENARVDIGRELEGLANGRVLPVTCPPEVEYSARLSVEVGYPLWGALQAYRTGHAVQWQAWSSAVARRSLGPDERQALLAAGSDYMFAYADRCARWMEAAYTQARDERLRGREQRRMQIVRELLAGNAVDAADLDYALDAWHIGVIATGVSAGNTLNQVLAASSGQTVRLAVDRTTWWGWIAGTEPSRLLQYRSRKQLPPGHSIAFGEPAAGAEGFAQTHREAQRASEIAATLGWPMVTHRQIALETLALSDERQARNFIERELGPLVDDGSRMHALRETLLAYFNAAQTASAAAGVLGVHERTVGNRLRAIEQLVGQPLFPRRAELETALRLLRVLNPDVDA